ncbi:extracellular solute-binding protein [Microbacterium sediminicola]|uniref:Extracellular solute-binding protein n=1 Tax=Microbacterium sediminicola TaxID=415210 RepID=A0ABP4UFJ5_9MICO
MSVFRGLTWDHPRGRHALEAAARTVAPGLIEWDVQPLEGFESAPIDELAARYDLLVLDHPHLGDAIATDSLQPIDALFPAEQVTAWRDAAVGPSIASYTVGDRLWALPLDAATQVSVRNPARVASPPSTWDEALALAEKGLVAMSLAGPHAFLSMCSIAVSLGDDPGNGQGLFAPDIAVRAYEKLAALSAGAPAGTADLNPIGLLDRMRDVGDIGYIPLIYGYVNYASSDIVFSDAPVGAAGVGSTIGGTGIAVSRRSVPSPELLAHLTWLLSETTQRAFIPDHDGQPSARAAWRDPRVDAAAHGFYSGTRITIEQSWVRPRRPGYIPFQSEASALLRDAIAGRRSPASVLAEIEERFAALPHMPTPSHAANDMKAPA